MALDLPTKTAIGTAADALERRAAFLRQLIEVLDEDPAVVRTLREALAAVGKNGSSPSLAKAGTGVAATCFDRVRAYFEANGNPWRSIPEVMADTSLSRDQVSQVTYKSHVESFERRDQMDGNRKTVKWRLAHYGGHGGES